MKNKKMKRVAALALAGTIVASTISPAAFADEPEQVEKREADFVPSVPLKQPTKTQADAAIDGVIWGESETQEDGSKVTTGAVNPCLPAENPGDDSGFTLETDGDVIKTEKTDGNTTTVTVVTPEDEPLHEEVVTEVPEEEPLTEEEKELVDAAEEVEDALTADSTGTDGEEKPDVDGEVGSTLEGKLESDKNANEETTAEDLKEAQEGAIEEALDVDEETGKGSVMVGAEEFDAEIVGTEVSQPQDTTPKDEEGKLTTDITEEATTTVTTTIKLTLEQLTPAEDEDAGKVNPKELGELLGEEIDTSKAPVIDSESGRITYTTTDGKTITVTKDESSLETGTGWIATITSEVVQGKGEADIEDVVDVTHGPNYVGSTVETSGGAILPYPDFGEAKNPSITQKELEEAINAANSEDKTVEIDGKEYTVTKVEGTEENYYKDTYTLTTTDEEGKYISYTIEKRPVITEENLTEILDKWGVDVSHTVTADTLKEMDEAQLQAVLGTDYKKGDNGEIYYTYKDAEGKEVTQEVTFEKDAAIGQVVAITVTKTNTHGAESGPQFDLGDAAYKDANENAQKDALKEALAGEAGISGEGEFVKKDDGSLAYQVGDKVYPVTQGQNGQWSVTVTEEKGDVTYTFTIKNNKLPTTGKPVDTTNETGKKEEVAAEAGLEAENIASVTTTTVTGSAVVTRGEAVWITTEEIKGILQENGCTIDEDDFKNAAVAMNEDGTTSVTVTSKDEYGNQVTTVYIFKTDSLTEEELAQWEDKLLQGEEAGASLSSTDDLQKVTWTIETTTAYNKTETVTDGDIKITGEDMHPAWVESESGPSQITTVTIEGWNEDDDKNLQLVKVEGTDKYYKYEWKDYELELEDDDDDPVYTIQKDKQLNAGNEDDKKTLEELLIKNTTDYGCYTGVAFKDNGTAILDDGKGNLLEVQYTATQTTVTKTEETKVEANNLSYVVKDILNGKYTVAGYDEYLKENDATATAENFQDWLKTKQSDRQAETQKAETPQAYNRDRNMPGQSYTITKVTSKTSTALELTVLNKKEINDSACNSGIAGSYKVKYEEKLNVEDWMYLPKYKGEGSADYDIYTEWLTTNDTYVAAGVQYGEVVTSELTCEGLDVKKQDVAPVGFDYQKVTTEVDVTHKVDIAERDVNVTAAIVTPAGGTSEDNGTPEQTVTFVMNEMPAVEEIAELDTPLAAPAVEEAVIEDEDVALSGAPETGDKLVDLADAEVAKSAVPKTGDESGIFLLMSMISGMALAALSFIDRKGRHSRFGSQH